MKQKTNKSFKNLKMKPQQFKNNKDKIEVSSNKRKRKGRKKCREVMKNGER